MRTINISELLNKEQLKNVSKFLNNNDNKGLRKYLNTLKEDLLKKGVVSDYLYYYLLYFQNKKEVLK